MIILGAALIGIIWVLRLTIDTNLFYYLSVFLIGLFHLFVSIPLDTVLFTRAKKLEPLSASTYLNTFSMVTKLVMYAILAVLVNVFQVSFILAAMGLFGVIVVNYFFIHFQKQVRHG
jgi:hypothetical protein